MCVTFFQQLVVWLSVLKTLFHMLHIALMGNTVFLTSFQCTVWMVSLHFCSIPRTFCCRFTFVIYPAWLSIDVLTFHIDVVLPWVLQKNNGKELINSDINKYQLLQDLSKKGTFESVTLLQLDNPFERPFARKSARLYPAQWQCTCDHHHLRPPFPSLTGCAGEILE